MESQFVGKVVTGFNVQRSLICGGGPDEGEIIMRVKIQFNDGSWVQLEPDNASSLKMSMVGAPPPLGRA